MSTNLAAVWLRICAGHVRTAEAARREALATRQAGGDPAHAILAELEAGLQAVSSAAHAVDAFYGRVAPSVSVPAHIRAAWGVRRTRRASRILETLKAAFDIGSRSPHWATELRWLYARRDAAVHHAEELRETWPHPVGVSVSKEAFDYRLENAERACRLAVAIVGQCVRAPRPLGGTEALAAQLRPGLIRLIREDETLARLAGAD